MAGLKEKYVVDERGKKTAVILGIHEYNRLKEKIEDYRDKLELQRAKKTAKSFTLLDDFIEELKAGGRL
jgi:PHD/YefM family antitoxin component YafN of YafNO toxin-antitoxin module